MRGLNFEKADWFHLLQEAANKLGICPTTLKRACRRHGIQRWPRRQLARLTRAIDQIRSSGGPEPPQVPAPSGRPLRSSSTALITTPPGSQESAPASSAAAAQSDPGADTRWSALNQLSHTFSAPLDEGSIHGPSRLPGTAVFVTAPAIEGSLSPALIHQPTSCPESSDLQLNSVLVPAEAEETNELGLPIGLAGLQPEDWTHLKEDPWSTSHSDKIGAVSAVAEPDSSHMQLDGDSCCMSLADGMVADEDETVHGVPPCCCFASDCSSISTIRSVS